MCEGTSKCNDMKSHLETNFTEDVLRFQSDDFFFYQPTEVRAFSGFVDYANEVFARPTEQVHIEVMDKERNIIFFMNCLKKNVEKVISKPIKDSDYEMSFSQNILDTSWLIPDAFNFNIGELIKKPGIQQLLDEGDIDTTQFEMFKGENIRITKDPVTLSELETINLQVPGLKNRTDFKDSRSYPFRKVD